MLCFRLSSLILLIQSCSFGSDSYSIILDDVNCSTSNYLVILQCSYSTTIDSNCVNGRDDASVTCCELKTQIWTWVLIIRKCRILLWVKLDDHVITYYKLHFLLCLYIQTLLVYGTILTVVWYDSLGATTLVRVWWRCTAMDSGALCVMIVSVSMMLK